jgi:hypothetical protein
MGPEDMHNEDHFEGKDYGHRELDAMFETLLHPPNLIQQFDNLCEFEIWTATGTIEDIEEMRKEFEKHDLFEHLIIIREVLLEKRREKELSDILSTNGIG